MAGSNYTKFLAILLILGIGGSGAGLGYWINNNINPDKPSFSVSGPSSVPWGQNIPVTLGEINWADVFYLIMPDKTVVTLYNNGEQSQSTTCLASCIDTCGIVDIVVIAENHLGMTASKSLQAP